MILINILSNRFYNLLYNVTLMLLKTMYNSSQKVLQNIYKNISLSLYNVYVRIVQIVQIVSKLQPRTYCTVTLRQHHAGLLGATFVSTLRCAVRAAALA